MQAATKSVKAQGTNNNSVADVTAAAAAASSALPSLPTLTVFPSATHTTDVAAPSASSSFTAMPAPLNPSSTTTPAAAAATSTAAATTAAPPAATKSYTRWSHGMEKQLLTAIKANTQAHDDVLPSQCRTGVKDRSHKRWGEIAQQVETLCDLETHEDMGKKCSDKFNKLKKHIASGLENMYNVFHIAARELSIVEVAATGGSLASADLQLSELMKHLTYSTNSYGPSVLKWNDGYEPPAPYLARWREIVNQNLELMELSNLMRSVYSQAKSARHASSKEDTNHHNHSNLSNNAIAAASSDAGLNVSIHDEIVGPPEEEKSMHMILPQPSSITAPYRKRKFAQTGASSAAPRDHSDLNIPAAASSFTVPIATDLLPPAVLDQITSSLTAFISDKLASMVPPPPTQFRVKSPDEWFNSIRLSTKQIQAVKRILGSTPTILLLAAFDEDLMNEHASELGFTTVQKKAWKILAEEAKRAC